MRFFVFMPDYSWIQLSRKKISKKIILAHPQQQERGVRKNKYAGAKP